MSTLRGKRIANVELHVPWAGAWWADVTLDVGAVVAPGPAELRTGDLTLQGSVLSDQRGFDAPDQPSCVVTGGAGWRSLLTQAGEYSSPVGVRLSTVLRDLAALAGEPYESPPELLLGTAYGWTASRPGAPRRARSVLDELVQRGAIPTWRIAPSGVTTFSPWPAGAVADVAGRVTKRRLTEGVRFVSLDTRVALFLPGGTLEGSIIRRVVIQDRGEALTAEIWE